MKVVCVCDDAKASALLNGRGLNEHYPVNRGIYTIRSTFFSSVSGELCVRLVEIVNRPHRYANGVGEVGFTAKSFKPLVDDANCSEVEAELFRSRRSGAPVKDHQRVPERVA